MFVHPDIAEAHCSREQLWSGLLRPTIQFSLSRALAPFPFLLLTTITFTPDLIQQLALAAFCSHTMPRVRAAVRPLPADAPPAAPAPAEVPSSMPTRRPPIRRAASTVPALPPTPPRTTHKRKRRSRSRVTDSSSEEEDEHEVPQPESDREDDASAEGRRIQPGAVAIGYKKRKTKTLDAIAEELSEARVEEQFWMGPSGSSAAVGSSNPPPTTRKVLKNRAPTRARSRSRTRSPSSSPPPAPHLLRRGHTGLMSPPPSRRAPAVVPRPATPPPTVRTKRIKGKAADLPQRDSPNNPFLAESVPASEDLSSPEPPAPQKHVEKPTMSVVLCVTFTFVSSLPCHIFRSSRFTSPLSLSPSLPHLDPIPSSISHSACSM